jgi:hypothetical protein
VRCAFALALDRPALTDATMGGYFSPATGGFVPTGILGHSPEIAFPHELLPLFYSRTHLLLKPWVKRYPISALGEFFWKDVVIEPH